MEIKDKFVDVLILMYGNSLLTRDNKSLMDQLDMSERQFYRIMKQLKEEDIVFQHKFKNKGEYNFTRKGFVFVEVLILLTKAKCKYFKIDQKKYFDLHNYIKDVEIKHEIKYDEEDYENGFIDRNTKHKFNKATGLWEKRA
jgi:predicted transcriptional regulator